jgi:hypothetical protein
MMVPSEKPASIMAITPSLSSVLTFSSFIGTLPASAGGLMILTVAEPVKFPSFSLPPRTPRERLDDLELLPDPKMSALVPGEAFGSLCVGSGLDPRKN